MGYSGRSLRKKPAPAPKSGGENEDIQPTGSQPIPGPPEFVRAVELQRVYWTHDGKEECKLEKRGVEILGWRELLRLHHLICLQRLKPGPERAAATEKCRHTSRRLIAPDSPYRPRSAMVWQGKPPQPGRVRKPDMQGKFLNLSITHLGCLEVYRVDTANRPTGIDFVSFDELAAVMFAPPSLIRAAMLFYDDGRKEKVLVPMLYGLTWEIGNEADREGSMTRFVAHLDAEELCTLGASGIAVGQQDFIIRKQDGKGSMFGLASLAQITFALEMSDPRFDEKARARGIDPDEVRREARRRMGGV